MLTFYNSFSKYGFYPFQFYIFNLFGKAGFFVYLVVSVFDGQHPWAMGEPVKYFLGIQQWVT